MRSFALKNSAALILLNHAIILCLGEGLVAIRYHARWNDFNF